MGVAFDGEGVAFDGDGAAVIAGTDPQSPLVKSRNDGKRSCL